MEHKSLEYRTAEGVHVRVDFGIFNRRCFSSEKLRDIQVPFYGIKLYHNGDTTPQRLRLYETFWLELAEEEQISDILERRLGELAKDKVDPDSLHEELEGYLEELRPNFDIRKAAKDQLGRHGRPEDLE